MTSHLDEQGTADVPGQIIFLNGVPNAGKTTLACTLQGLLDDPYWHLSLDDFLRGYTARHWMAPQRPSFAQVMYGYLRSLRQLALCGNSLIAEAVFAPGRVNTYLDLFGDFRILLVGLHVPLEVARAREEARTDRLQPYEVTERDVVSTHAHGLYDLELDMVTLTPEAAARRVMNLVTSPPHASAFQCLIERRYAGKT